MKATFVHDVLTPVQPAELCVCLAEAWRSIIGGEPEPKQLAVLMAQSALETGRWKSIHCCNLGNVKASESYEGLFTCFRCNEVIGGNVEWFEPSSGGFAVPPGHPQTRFRAFGTLQDGVSDYLKTLIQRFARAWPSVLAGDPAGFVHALKQSGYFTAPELPYLRAVVSLFGEYASSITQWLAGAADERSTVVSDADLDAARAAVAGSSWAQAQEAIPLAGESIHRDEDA